MDVPPRPGFRHTGGHGAYETDAPKQPLALGEVQANLPNILSGLLNKETTTTAVFFERAGANEAVIMTAGLLDAILDHLDHAELVATVRAHLADPRDPEDFDEMMAKALGEPGPPEVNHSASYDHLAPAQQADVRAA